MTTDVANGLAEQTQRRFLANVHALAARQPALAQRLTQVKPSGRYQLVATDAGPEVAGQEGDDWRLLRDPAPEVVRTPLPECLEKTMAAAGTVVVGASGAKALIDRLVAWPVTGGNGVEPTIHLLEADEELLFFRLLCADWRSAAASPRVHWWTGPDACDRVIAYIEADWRRPLPELCLYLRPDWVAAVNAASQRRGQASSQAESRLASYYEHLPGDHWDRIFGDDPPRRPRVTLITSQFTTFLKYSTRDAAEAFAAIGWDVDVLIEAADDQRVTPAYLAQRLDAFRPDLLFQIDHLRFEWPVAVPPRLPFVCWAQDEMPATHSPEAPRRLGPADFLAVMGSGLNMIRRYGYPPRQVVVLPMCVAPSSLDAAPAVHTPAEAAKAPIAFVSHHGWTPRERLGHFFDRFEIRSTGNVPAAHRQFHDLAQRICERIESSYAAGGACTSRFEYQHLLEQAERDAGIHIGPEAMRELFIRELFLMIGGACYRQQALGWLAEAGFELALYGKGWDTHPRFKAFARGEVANGPDLWAVYRSTPINLQLTPFGNDHQRLWEGAVAGGFFLMRRHPADATTTVGRRVLGTLREGRFTTFDELLRDGELDPAARYVVENFWRDAMGGRTAIDAEALELFERNLAPPSLTEQLGEGYEAVTFDGRDDLLVKVQRYLADPDARRAAATALREAARRRTYRAQLPGLVAQLHERLRQAMARGRAVPGPGVT